MTAPGRRSGGGEGRRDGRTETQNTEKNQEIHDTPPLLFHLQGKILPSGSPGKSGQSAMRGRHETSHRIRQNKVQTSRSRPASRSAKICPS